MRLLLKFSTSATLVLLRILMRFVEIFALKFNCLNGKRIKFACNLLIKSMKLDIKLQHSVAPCRPDFAFRFFYRLCATSVNILSLFSLYCHYMFRPNRPSSGAQVVVMKEFAAHCNAVLLFVCSFFGLTT
jgi:hypothetical protein